MGRGRVYIVGAGPGDPELITVKGLRLLAAADAIVYDRLAPRELLSLAKPSAKLYYVGKEPGRHHASQEEINKLLRRLAEEGLVVVRLHGGDPYTYGRGEEECIYLLDHGIPCEVVPGVPSYTAAAAAAGTPLATRLASSSFAVATGTEAAERREKRVDLKRIAASVDTVAVLMAARRAREVLGEIAEARGWETPAVIVVEATRPSQRVYEGTLGSLAEALAKEGGVEPPAVIIAGSGVEVRRRICGRRGSYC